MSSTLTYSSPMTSAIIVRTSASTASGVAALWSREVGPGNEVLLSRSAAVGRRGVGDEGFPQVDVVEAGAGGSGGELGGDRGQRGVGVVVDVDHGDAAP